MKKFIEEKHDLLAGIFAVLAVGAIICEIVFADFSKDSIVAGIKDVSGILIDVLVLFVAASALIRKPVNFKEKFKKAIEEIKNKYSPLLIEDKKEGTIRYNIASNSDALFSGDVKEPKRFFELDEDKPSEISFYINKSFFDQKGGTDFDAKDITGDIKSRLESLPYFKDFKCYSKSLKENYMLCVKFNRQIKSKEDIDMLINLIDYTLLIFVARNKS